MPTETHPSSAAAQESPQTPRELAERVVLPILQDIAHTMPDTGASTTIGDAVDYQSCLCILQWTATSGSPCKVEVTLQHHGVVLKIGAESPRQLSVRPETVGAIVRQQIIQAIHQNRCAYTLDHEDIFW